ELLAQPAHADADGHASSREHVDGGQHLGRQHRIAVGQDHHAGDQPQRAGAPGDERDEGELFERVAAPRERARHRVRILRGDGRREDDVVGDHHRVKSERLPALHDGLQRLGGCTDAAGGQGRSRSAWSGTSVADGRRAHARNGITWDTAALSASHGIPASPTRTYARHHGRSRIAAMAMHRVVLNYEDYAALPDDGRRYEVHDGELSVTPAPGTHHQRVSRNLNEILGAHVRTRGLGEVLYAPVDVILANTTVVQPDLIFIAPAHASRISRRGIEGAPTLAVE